MQPGVHHRCATNLAITDAQPNSQSPIRNQTSHHRCANAPPPKHEDYRFVRALDRQYNVFLEADAMKYPIATRVRKRFVNNVIIHVDAGSSTQCVAANSY
jgi:hypothetical protein